VEGITFAFSILIIEAYSVFERIQYSNHSWTKIYWDIQVPHRQISKIYWKISHGPSVPCLLNMWYGRILTNAYALWMLPNLLQTSVSNWEVK